MTTHLTVRDLAEQLQRIDPDARIELEVRHTVTHTDPEFERDQVETYTETEPLADLRVHCSGQRYVTLRG